MLEIIEWSKNVFLNNSKIIFFIFHFFFQILALIFEAGLKQEKCTIFVEKQGRWLWDNGEMTLSKIYLTHSIQNCSWKSRWCSDIKVENFYLSQLVVQQPVIASYISAFLRLGGVFLVWWVWKLRVWEWQVYLTHIR